MNPMKRIIAGLGAAACLAFFLASGSPAQDLDAKVKEAEAKRIAVIEKVKPSVVAIFSAGGNGGGSGVLISDDGYALTNFHVTAGAGNTMKCGLPDGVLYDGVLVGLDKVGDVALIKLYPKKEGQKFPFAVMGNSDDCKAGDWSLAMGNPFLLATDFNPTVTYGLISGVHRYQYPSGLLLEYTDCIQIDTSINPGNSGGPLFNMNGELIGINGRGSFDKRSRINSGVGYAISINQIKNFLGHLRAGLDTDHASLGAIVESEADDGANPRMLVKAILESADVTRRGLNTDDELVSFAGRRVGSVNQYKNVLGLYPRGWRMPFVYRRNDVKHDALVRLMGVQRQEIPEDKNNPMPAPAPGPGPRPAPVPTKPSPVAKFFEAKPGFANHYFNKLEKERLWKAFQKNGDFTGMKGEWVVKALGEADNRQTKMDLSLREDGEKTNCTMTILGIDYHLDPLATKIAPADLLAPPKSGGLLMSMFLYRQLLTHGGKGFAGGEFTHGGVEPYYPPGPKGAKPDYKKIQVMAEVLRTRFTGVNTKWYFSQKDQTLLGFEVSFDSDEDPCEVCLLDYKDLSGRKLPGKIVIRHGDATYAELTNIEWGLAAK
jgi:S1-C subfamily serine protease